MRIREQCEQNFQSINPKAKLSFNMLVHLFGWMTWMSANKDDYAEMRTILAEILSAIDEAEKEGE
mgnify:CR=1 FL=1|tara:strand:- start:402 stop:596 length:195 start_codon:yes stop_codon:yes gene_type:complete